MNAARKTGRITRADVARLANVSTASVSYVLNGVPNKVSEETAQRIRRAAQILDYRPSAFARALKTGSSQTFGVIVPDFSNPYFASLNDEIESAAAEQGYSIIFTTSHGDAKAEHVCINRLQDRNVDVIFTSSALSNEELAALDQQHCRLVFLDHTVPTPGVKCVATDFSTAVMDMTNHLFSHGHTRIALLYGGDDLTDPRIQGWQAAHQHAGLPTGTVLRSHFTREGGYQATLQLIDDARETGASLPTALFAASDLEAIGALRALHERHMRVPEDITLVSFDGSSETLYSNPQLTTLQQNTHAIAKLAVEAAIAPDAVPDVSLVKAALVIRHSCGC